jgi:AAA family ATP:ADP antiporter
MGATVPTLILITGALQNGLGKAAKFSLFDCSKEMAFTALPNERKWSSKIAIDGVGTYVAKTATAATQSSSIFLFGGAAACTPFFGIGMLAMLALWMAAVQNAGKEYEQLVEAPTT